MTQRSWRGLVALALLAAVGWLLWAGWGRVRPPAASVPSAPSALGTVLSGSELAPSSPGNGLPALQPGAVESRGASASQPRAAYRAGPEDHCGLGLARGPEPVAGKLLTAASEAANARAQQALLQALAGSGDVEAQAVALYLRRTPFAQRFPNCPDGDDAACDRVLQRAIKAQEARDGEAGTLQALLVLAERSDSSLVQSLAWQACLRPAEAMRASCGGFSVAKWASLEPDNAQVWLALAAERAAAGDVAGQHHAMHRAANAQRSASSSTALMRIAMAHLPPDVVGMPRLETTVRLIGVAVGGVDTLHGLQSLSAYCAADALTDANRLQVCRQTANMLMTVGGDLLQRSIGQSIAKRTGDDHNDAARAVEQLRTFLYQQSEADLNALSGIDLRTSSGCAAVEAQSLRLEQLGTQGEVAHWQRRMAKAEKPR